MLPYLVVLIVVQQPLIDQYSLPAVHISDCYRCFHSMVEHVLLLKLYPLSLFQIHLILNSMFHQ
jgi:hypothetical protein